MTIGMVRSARDRTDANWDLQNYHLYGPFAALNGRIGRDYFVAGFQGYFNPLADIPYYVAKFILFPSHPFLVALLAGLPFGLLIFVVFKIARIFLPQGAPWEAALAAVLGLTGATTLSEVGTTYDDIGVAAIVLLGLWAALARPVALPWAAMLAGLAAGSATALKFTAALFVPGLLVFCLLQTRDWRQTIWPALGFGLGVAIGFLALWGWWGWVLWRHFHNPFFPLFGTFFPSIWSPPVAAADPRFFPRNAWQWLFYPFFWLQGRSFIVSEEPLRDPRFALVYLALAIRLGAMPWHKGPGPSRMVFALWVFFAISYCLWLTGFSILRYAMPLEVLSGVVIWTALRPIFKGRFTLALVVLCLGCIHFTDTVRWGRIRDSQSLVEAPIPVLPAGSLVFMQGQPLGFVVPYLYTPSSQFISLDASLASPAVFSYARQRAANGRNVFVLTNLLHNAAAQAATNTQLARYDLTYAESACVPVRSPVQQAIRLCKAGIMNR